MDTLISARPPDSNSVEESAGSAAGYARLVARGGCPLPDLDAGLHRGSGGDLRHSARGAHGGAVLAGRTTADRQAAWDGYPNGIGAGLEWCGWSLTTPILDRFWTGADTPAPTLFPRHIPTEWLESAAGFYAISPLRKELWETRPFWNQFGAVLDGSPPRINPEFFCGKFFL